MNPPTGSRQLREAPAAETAATELDAGLLVVATGAPPQAASNIVVTVSVSVLSISPGSVRASSSH
jgi:hypothetical protein